MNRRDSRETGTSKRKSPRKPPRKSARKPARKAARQSTNRSSSKADVPSPSHADEGTAFAVGRWYSVRELTAPGGTPSTPAGGADGGTGATIPVSESPLDEITWAEVDQHPDVAREWQLFQAAYNEHQRVKRTPVSDTYTREQKNADLRRLSDAKARTSLSHARLAEAVKDRTHM